MKSSFGFLNNLIFVEKQIAFHNQVAFREKQKTCKTKNVFSMEMKSNANIESNCLEN